MIDKRILELASKVLAVASASALLALLLTLLPGVSFASATWGVFMLCGVGALVSYLIAKRRK